MAENKTLGRQLILDEMFDLFLYREFAKITSGDLRDIFNALVPVEEKHVAFWENFFGLHFPKLNLARRLKLRFIAAIVAIFGDRAAYIVIEAIEVHGIKKYLKVWELYREDSLGEAIKGILQDEFDHEDRIVTERSVKKIDPGTVRDILFGFNDGLVEILGAISGFFAAFQNGSLVFLAGMTVAVAGAISMAAGGFASVSSESEVADIEAQKKNFLADAREMTGAKRSPARAAWLVGISYFIAAILPLAPVLFGSKSILLSLLIGGMISVVISVLLSFISGMETRRRIGLNLLIIAIAVVSTYLIGAAAKSLLGSSMV